MKPLKTSLDSEHLQNTSSAKACCFPGNKKINWTLDYPNNLTVRYILPILLRDSVIRTIVFQCPNVCYILKSEHPKLFAGYLVTSQIPSVLLSVSPCCIVFGAGSSTFQLSHQAVDSWFSGSTPYPKILPSLGHGWWIPIPGGFGRLLRGLIVEDSCPSSPHGILGGVGEVEVQRKAHFLGHIRHKGYGWNSMAASESLIHDPSNK